MMGTTRWDKFFREKIRKILTEKKNVIDIGGGLRISKERGNRSDPAQTWIADLIAENATRYQVLDPTPEYHPDIVGDIHALPFPDNSQEAMICLAVLEHVEDPWLACRELRRVLKPGGYCLVYVPFLYYFHAERGYYHDYWRYTHEAINLLFKDFSFLEICGVRGRIATWLHLSPLGRIKLLVAVANFLDNILGKTASHQVSGYYVFMTK